MKIEIVLKPIYNLPNSSDWIWLGGLALFVFLMIIGQIYAFKRHWIKGSDKFHLIQGYIGIIALTILGLLRGFK